MNNPLRSQVFMVDVPEIAAEKPFVVVSNNHRNQHLSTVVGARITTAPRSIQIPSVVPITDRGAVVGSVLCDDLRTIETRHLKRRIGALPPQVMEQVNAGLRSALDCD